ncbi:DUF2214 family protein [Paraglaciecola sp. L3A3]|uniref:DUF2214 family protein n=1 Tax=Paraglaciecola sp. L3A3 TaxID=2686358 RepID=UPI00131BA5F9|nr:DUF2214 family protein [Paraglaciecola sp. L3A3]
MDEILVRYCHFIGIIVLAGTLVAKHMMLTGELNLAQMQKIARIDRVYGLSALIVLLAGLTLWFGVGKPAEFYAKNWVFHLKVSLFIVMALLSIYPTIYINKICRAKQKLVNVPKSIINTVRLELTCLVIIPLSAVYMAKGYGLYAS